MTAYNAEGLNNGVDEQQTRYIYDDALNGSLQTAVVYPDSTDYLSQNPSTNLWTITSGSDHVSTTYDVMGRVATTTDQRGVVHQYVYDSVGRLTGDEVTSLGDPSQHVDGTVRAIVTTYDNIGRVEMVVSFGSAWNPVNEVQYAYDGWGNLAQEWQACDGWVGTETTPSVQYVYDDGLTPNSTDQPAPMSGLADVVYPTESLSTGYYYGEADSPDYVLSRVAAITDGTGQTHPSGRIHVPRRRNDRENRPSGGIWWTRLGLRNRG